LVEQHCNPIGEMSIKIEQSREDINSNAGILLLGQLLQLSGWRKIDALRPERIKEGVYSHSTLLKVIIVLLALGRCDFADIPRSQTRYPPFNEYCITHNGFSLQ
jgi:hypothetical protein